MLDRFSKMLVYGGSDQFGSMRWTEFVSALSSIFQSSPTEPVFVSCCDCVHHLIDLVNDSARPFARSGVLGPVCGILSHSPGRAALEGCLRVLDAMAEFAATELSGHPVVEHLLSSFWALPLADQRKLIQIVQRIVESGNAQSFGRCLPILSELLTHDDSKVLSATVRTFCAIGSSADPSSIPSGVMAKLAAALLCLTDGTKVWRILRVVERLVRSDSHAASFLSQPLDFELVLEQTDAKGKFMDVLAAILTVIQILLPPPDGYRSPFIARRLPGAEDFASLVCLPRGHR
jgi:hypothetical protein